MKELILKKRELDFDKFIKRSALESDYDTLICESAKLYDKDTGQLKIVYVELGDSINFNDVVNAIKKIRYDTGMRSRGLKSQSRIFGYRPRLEMRQDYCSSTSLAQESPSEHAVICSAAKRIEGFYSKEAPTIYEKHKNEVEKKIRRTYRIADSVFTSGIINKNNPLKYHFDTGNFVDVSSAMLVFKGGSTGGHLSVPEYGVGFELKNNSLFMFDGQGILHGVTPIKKESPLAYRYSIVFYSLKRIWQCLEVDEELARIRRRKTKRENDRLDPEHLKRLGKVWENKKA